MISVIGLVSAVMALHARAYHAYDAGDDVGWISGGASRRNMAISGEKKSTHIVAAHGLLRESFERRDAEISSAHMARR